MAAPPSSTGGGVVVMGGSYPHVVTVPPPRDSAVTAQHRPVILGTTNRDQRPGRDSAAQTGCDQLRSTLIFGAVQAHNPKVVGSNPTPPLTIYYSPWLRAPLCLRTAPRPAASRTPDRADVLLHRFEPLFSEEQRGIARSRLQDHGFDVDVFLTEHGWRPRRCRVPGAAGPVASLARSATSTRRGFGADALTLHR